MITRRARLEVPWLRQQAKRRVIELLACEAAAETRRLKERLAWWQQLRYLEVGAASLGLLARDTDTLILHPLQAPLFWNAVAAAWGPHGFADRTEGVRRLFGDLLPEPIVTRSSKTTFDKVFWTERARSFARGWDGSGVPLQWVDARALARHWAGSRPIVPSSFLFGGLAGFSLRALRGGVRSPSRSRSNGAADRTRGRDGRRGRGAPTVRPARCGARGVGAVPAAARRPVRGAAWDVPTSRG